MIALASTWADHEVLYSSQSGVSITTYTSTSGFSAGAKPINDITYSVLSRPAFSAVPVLPPIEYPSIWTYPPVP